MNLKTIVVPSLTLLLGAAISYAWLSLYGSGVVNSADSEQKPLYWVAPMDANYRRDEAGLSPMGMALVPVFA
ncbi:MAG: heavy metal-binding domain-containing protein, partial [Bermanella sp.]